LSVGVVPENEVDLKIEHQQRLKTDEFFTILKFVFDEEKGMENKLKFSFPLIAKVKNYG